MTTAGAGRHDILIEQGSTFSFVATWSDPEGNPIDVTGCTARMQVRPWQESDTVLLSLTTENGGITLGGPDGTVTLLASDEVTTNLPAGYAIYDIEIETAAGDVTRLLQGAVDISAEVTR
jgi:hypothetical protein